MNKYVLSLLIGLGILFPTRESSANTPGDYQFAWSPAMWFYFANGYMFDSGADGVTPDSWYASSDASGNLGFEGQASPNSVYGSSYLVAGSYLSAQFFIDNVTGTWNQHDQTGVWKITMHIAFFNRAISESTCTTSQFEVVFDGNYWGGGYSDDFTIPRLSGTGAQGCASNARTINTDFDLGTLGAEIYFGKFNIWPVVM